MTSTAQLEKSKDAERAFEAWLKREGFAYLAICQNDRQFAPLFQGNLKRPDFLVLLESIGMIAVDVKAYTLTRGEYTLSYEAEFRLAMTFERVFRLPVWYAYWGAEAECTYWISALKAVEVGKIRQNGKDKRRFLAIKLKHSERIETNADFGKLYTQRLPGLSKIKTAAIS